MLYWVSLQQNSLRERFFDFVWIWTWPPCGRADTAHARVLGRQAARNTQHRLWPDHGKPTNLLRPPSLMVEGFLGTMSNRSGAGSAVSSLVKIAGAAAAVGVVGAAAAFAYNAVSARKKRSDEKSVEFDDPNCTDVFKQLVQLFESRIAYIDGAMGTSIQEYDLQEEDFRGERYKDHSHELKGNDDVLVITRPDTIEEIHTSFLNAGADIIATNTLNATTISMSDFGLETVDEVRLINHEAAKLAKKCTQRYMDEHPGQRKYVAGAIGPMNKMLSVSSAADNPAMRDVTYDEVKLVRSPASPVQRMVHATAQNHVCVASWYCFVHAVSSTCFATVMLHW